MKNTYLILGATSGIAKALCRVLAEKGHALILAGRSGPALETLAQDIRERYRSEIKTLPFDAEASVLADTLVSESTRLNDGELIEGVVLAYATMPAQLQTEADLGLLERMLQINFVSSVCILQAFANAFAARGSGAILGISSVAGDRGRGSNFHYGSTKAGLSAYLDGLRHRLHKQGVFVCTIKPGFVATPLTDGIVNPNSPLCASADRAARDILSALAKKKPTVYTLWIWRWIMTIIKHLPEFIFIRTKL